MKSDGDKTKSPTSLVEQQLSELNRVKEKATLMFREVDQLIAKIAAADQSWHEALSKIQTLTDNLPETDPHKEQLTTFVKLQLEGEEAIKTGKPLAKSKEIDQALEKRADYEENQNNQIVDNNLNTNTATVTDVNQEQKIVNNDHKTKTDQMIARLTGRGYPLPGEKAVEKISNDCKVNSTTNIILPPLTTLKTQIHKTQVNKR